MSAVAGEQAECFGFFPFVTDFTHFVDGVVDYEHLGRIRATLEPAVAVLQDGLQDGQLGVEGLDAYLVMRSVLLRISVADVYSYDLSVLEWYGRSRLLNALESEWHALCERTMAADTPVVASVVSHLSALLDDVWQLRATYQLVTVADVVEGGSLDVRVRRAGGVYLASSEERGKPLAACVLDETVPVMPRGMYKRLLPHVASLLHAGDVTPNACMEVAERVVGKMGCAMSAGTLASFLWVLTERAHVSGYCYQYVFHPRDRQLICALRGVNPTLDSLRAYRPMAMTWAGVEARLSMTGERVHVERSGRWPNVLDTCDGQLVVGAEDKPDYFARGLVDDFVRNVLNGPRPVVQPLDTTFEDLTVSTERGARTIQSIAETFYAGVGEDVSPATRGGGKADKRDGVEHRGRRDEARRLDLARRVEAGAVIPESYFLDSQRRSLMSRRRPKLETVRGRMCHVFAAFADDDAGLGSWQEDDRFDLSGWKSYVANFRDDERLNMNFRPPDADFDPDTELHDIRMDCTGDGRVDFGSVRMPTDGTVIWFTRSVRFRLETYGPVVLRITVPVSGKAMAFTPDMRRYMHVPGMAVVVQCFDVRKWRDVADVRLKRLRDVGVGATLYRGEMRVAEGKHPFRLSGLASGQPVRMLVKAQGEPSDLEYVVVSDVCVRPAVRDSVSVLYEPNSGSMYVRVRRATTLTFSVFQIVSTSEFDLMTDTCAMVAKPGRGSGLATGVGGADRMSYF